MISFGVAWVMGGCRGRRRRWGCGGRRARRVGADDRGDLLSVWSAAAVGDGLVAFLVRVPAPGEEALAAVGDGLDDLVAVGVDRAAGGGVAELADDDGDGAVGAGDGLGAGDAAALLAEPCRPSGDRAGSVL